jgi:hypothetical protein
LFLLFFFWPQINKKKKKERENTKKKLKYVGRISKHLPVRRVYLNARRIAKDWLRRIKHIKLKNLTVYFLLIKALLTKKIQLDEGNLKLDV